MLWRGIELSTFDVETLREWLDRLEDERSVIQAEIDRRAVTGMDPLLRPTDPEAEAPKASVKTAEKVDRRPTGGPVDLKEAISLATPSSERFGDPPTDRGAPPRRDEAGG